MCWRVAKMYFLPRPRGDKSGDVSLMAGYLGWWSVHVGVNL